MLQIIVQGRGGQGAQTAGNLLAAAFYREGRQVQSFATYGGARRGTPVSSFIRVDERPIRLRCDIDRADAILCFDTSLLEAGLSERAAPGALIVVNSARPPAAWQGRDGVRILPIDGIAISQRHGLGRMVNSALLGALACALGTPSLEAMTQTLARSVPGRRAENIEACREAHEETRRLLELPSCA